MKKIQPPDCPKGPTGKTQTVNLTLTTLGLLGHCLIGLGVFIWWAQISSNLYRVCLNIFQNQWSSWTQTQTQVLNPHWNLTKTHVSLFQTWESFWGFVFNFFFFFW